MRGKAVVVVAALVLSSSVPGAQAVGSEPTLNADDQANRDEESGVPPSPEGLERDLALIAEAHGWTIEQTRERHRVMEELAAILEELARESPDKYVGAALGDGPGHHSTLYVKGPADERIIELVRSTGASIVVADHQPFSFDELEARKLRVHHALSQIGFRNVGTAVNIGGAGVIPAAVTAEPGLPDSASEILELLPADIRDSVLLTVRQAPLFRTFSGFGGMWMRDGDLEDICTSGWSVVDNETGVGGITTAAHCPNIQRVWHFGHGVHDLTWRDGHIGGWGDVEWHGIPNESEPDDFYADEFDIRDVAGVIARSAIMEDQPACVWGRGTNDRDCSLEVLDVSAGCQRADGFVYRMVAMNGTTSGQFDSGGGWSLGGTAYGSVIGECFITGVNEVWSVADLYDEAIGVRVKCGC